MTKDELLKKHGKELLEAVAYYEDTEPFKPFYHKAEQVAKETGVHLEKAEEALRDYQHFMEL